MASRAEQCWRCIPTMERGKDLSRSENKLKVLDHHRYVNKAVRAPQNALLRQPSLSSLKPKKKKLPTPQKKRPGKTKAQTILAHSEMLRIPRDLISHRRATGEVQKKAMTRTAHSWQKSAQVVQREAPLHSPCHQKMMRNVPPKLQRTSKHKVPRVRQTLDAVAPLAEGGVVPDDLELFSERRARQRARTVQRKEKTSKRARANKQRTSPRGKIKEKGKLVMLVCLKRSKTGIAVSLT